MSRRIRLWHVNLVLWAVIAVLGWTYRGALSWAFADLPRYLSGRIGAPEERRLYRQARKLLLDQEDLPRAEKMLERSIAIDPNGEAVYWLGRLYLQRREFERAREQFEHYLTIDPRIPDTYLSLATCHEKQGRDAEALAVLRRGAAYFTRIAPLYEPRYDLAELLVDPKFHQKATLVHRNYLEAAATMLAEAARLEAAAGQPGHDNPPDRP